MKAKQWFTNVLSCVVTCVAMLSIAGNKGVEKTPMQHGILDELKKTPEERLTVAGGVVESFREAAMEDPAAAVEYFFTKRAREMWKVRITSELLTQQLTDFFTGAIVLDGPADNRKTVECLYNPWWDTLLVLKQERVEISSDNSPFQIAQFVLMSGETFRGESDVGNVLKCVTVVPGEDPLSVEIWRVVSGTRKRFMQLLPLENANAATAWSKIAAIQLKVDDVTEMKRIQTRSLLRLQHSVSLLKNAKDTGIAATLTRLVRKGTLYQLYSHFREPNSRSLLQSFSEVPEMFRKSFTPYCYIPTSKATLYVFVNKDVPRLFVTVTIAPTPTALTSSMEWYDLLQADELLSAWNNRKAVAK